MTKAFDAVPEKAEYNQYWYSARTIDALLREVRHHATACAFLSTPSLFFALDADVNEEDTTRMSEEEKAEEKDRRAALREASRLFEHDPQWSTEANYVAYDYRTPEQLPVQYAGYFDYVVADPPFISAEVWRCYLASVRWLLKKGGKVLFTTVLENHAMLEAGLDGPLFIPLFRPCIPRLTYQYMCFLNYEPTTLNHLNDELPPVTDAAEVKLLRAIAMANEIRQSETAFVRQLAERDRAGERGLPTAAFEREQQQQQQQEQQCGVSEQAIRTHSGDVAAAAVCDWATTPLEKMPWGYIPEHLRPYMYPVSESSKPEKENAKAAAAASGVAAGAAQGESSEVVNKGEQEGEKEDESRYGTRYMTIRQLREQLDAFKHGVDAVQKLLDQQMRGRMQRVKLTKQLAAGDEKEAATAAEAKAALAAVSDEIARLQSEREAQLAKMSAVAQRIRDAEHTLCGATSSESAGETMSPSLLPPYLAALDDCLTAYGKVEVRRAALQELAAEATRKYKSPLFHRMRELLQEMKAIKSAASAQVAL